MGTSGYQLAIDRISDMIQSLDALQESIRAWQIDSAHSPPVKDPTPSTFSPTLRDGEVRVMKPTSPSGVPSVPGFTCTGVLGAPGFEIWIALTDEDVDAFAAYHLAHEGQHIRLTIEPLETGDGPEG